jgi:hypothetical protein
MEEAPSVKIDSREDNSTSFLEKVRRSKEMKTQSVRPTPSTSSPTSKLSMDAYRASRGLPPLSASISPTVPSPPPRQSSTSSYKITAPIRVASPGMSSAASSLFINKKKPPVSVSYHKFSIALYCY